MEAVKEGVGVDRFDASYVRSLLEQFSSLPRFDDGRINFRGSRVASVVNVFVRWDDEVLLLRRSEKVQTYHGYWSVIGGFLDEAVSVVEKALEEVKEEIGVDRSMVESVVCGGVVRVDDSSLGRSWIVHPVSVRLRERPMVRLDWEHTAFQWVREKELSSLSLIPGFFEAWSLVRDT